LILLFKDHSDRTLGTDRCTNAASFAVIQVDQDLSGLFITRDTEVRTKEAADLTRFTSPEAQTALGLIEGFFLTQTQLDRFKSFPPFC